MAIPKKDALLVPYSANWATRTTASPTEFGLTAVQAENYSEMQAAYLSAYNAMMAARADGTRSQSLTSMKETTKAALLTYNRELYAFVQASSNVADSDKILLGVTIRKTTPTPVPAPTDRPKMDITAVVARTVTVAIHGSTAKSAKPAGSISAFLYYFVGSTYPSDPTLWQFYGPATKPTFDIVFPDSVASGAQVWICAAWVSRRGETGPASVPVSTNIQGGGVSASSNMKIAA